MRVRAAWHAGALAAFLLAALWLSRPVWQEGPAEIVLVNSVASTGEELRGFWKTTSEADTTFVAWLVGRNARVLLGRPWRLFDAEHCAPTANSLALSEPLVTLGLLATPAWLLSGDPIVTYNAALLTMRVVMALALYALLVGWTRSPPAGIAAGLLYAFHPIWTRDVTHAFIYDTGWTALALLFAQRLFARGRWRDALALAACVALQMGTSLYPMLAAVCLALPFAVWLLVHYGFGHVRAAQLAVVGGLVLIAAVLIYGPFLELRDSAQTLRAKAQFEAVWGSFLPGGLRFPGWMLLSLAAAALALGRRRCLPGLEGDPRWVLLLGGLLVALAATGPSQPALGPVSLPNLYGLLSAVLPGLDAVRAVGRVSSGVHLALCILAGLGAAALLGLAPAGRARGAAAAALIALAWLSSLGPGLPGLPARAAYRTLAVRPSAETLAFFAELERRGNTGPLAEFPVAGQGRATVKSEAERILASAWHRRRTTACYGSFRPPAQRQVRALLSEVPAPEALRGLHALGLDTLVLHGPAPLLRRRLQQASGGPDAVLRRLGERGELSAWLVQPPGP